MASVTHEGPLETESRVYLKAPLTFSHSLDGERPLESSTAMPRRWSSGSSRTAPLMPWVGDFTPTNRLPSSRTEPSTPRPRTVTYGPLIWDVYARDGTHLYAVRGSRITDMDGRNSPLMRLILACEKDQHSFYVYLRGQARDIADPRRAVRGPR